MAPLEPPDEIDVKEIIPILEEHASRSAFIIELGCGDGHGSLRAMARGLRRSTAKNKLYISVDIRPDRPKFSVPDEDWWFKVTGDSKNYQTLKQVWEQVAHRKLVAVEGDDIRQADIIFVDSWHSYEQVKGEIDLWKIFAGPRTTWYFHDIWMFGKRQDLTDAILEFAAEDGWKYDDIPNMGHGLGRLTK